MCVLFFASLCFNALFLRGDGQEVDRAPQEIRACIRKEGRQGVVGHKINGAIGQGAL